MTDTTQITISALHKIENLTQIFAFSDSPAINNAGQEIAIICKEFLSKNEYIPSKKCLCCGATVQQHNNLFPKEFEAWWEKCNNNGKYFARAAWDAGIRESIK